MKSIFQKITLYWRTSKYLTLSQIYFRLLLIFRKRCLYRFNKLTKFWYGYKSQKRINKVNKLNFGSSEFHKLLGRSDRIGLNEPADTFKFTFLNKTLTFKDKVDWLPDDATFLWRYNLHYFDYAYDLSVAYLQKKDEKYYTLFKSLVTDWHENNPIAHGIGWDPYPTSLRIVNWIKAYHFFYDIIQENNDFKKQLLSSIYIQTNFLNDNVEYHLLNNHIIENARALFVAGHFFDNQQWQKKGLKILWKELKRQVLKDGGQFELSPMYHAVVVLVFADVLLILQGLNQTVPEWVIQILKRMVDFYEHLCMPDGEIAYFNDAAQGMTVSALLLKKAFLLLNLSEKSNSNRKLITFHESGYFILQSPEHQSKCIFDCGTMGPDFQPGHGHCDTLSYIWSYKGQRVIVDSGVDDYYREDAWRNYYRSTRAHNTMEIDGVEQSEIWGNFRVGRRAHPLPVKYYDEKNIISVHGSHDGYFYLSDKVLHQRVIALLDGKIFIVFDQIDGELHHKIKNYLHFHPQFKTKNINKRQIYAIGANFDLTILPFGNINSIKKMYGQTDPILGWYTPAYGETQKNEVLILSTKDKLPIQMGYCIIPNEKPGSVDYHSLKWYLKNSDCFINLKVGMKQYNLKCSSHKISLLENR